MSINKGSRSRGHISVVPFIILFAVLAGFMLGYYFTINVQKTYNSNNYYYDDYNYYNDTNYFESLEYTDVLYVSPDGNNSDGLTWAAAFTTIQAALANASSDLNDITLILIAPGIYDMNTAGIYVVNKNVRLFGTRPNLVTITNTHASATGILQFNKYGGMYNLHILCGAGITNGIIVNSSASVDSTLSQVLITDESPDVHFEGILLTNGTYRFLAEELYVQGNNMTTGIRTDNSYHNVFNDVYMNNCSIGIHLNNTNDDNNVFKTLNILNCQIGILIDSGDQQTFNDITFLDNVRNVYDKVGNSIYSEIKLDNPRTYITPDDLVGIEVLGAGAETYGDEIVVCPAISRENPFVIVAVIYSFSVPQNAGMRLSATNGSTYFFESILRVSSSFIVERRDMDLNYPQVFNTHTAITCSIKTTTGDDTANVWLQIKEI